ncbi:hypothetical protein ACFY0G_21990 [Streptomyces sp. NPDC001552]|uniref:hypothetical protein n=1 Tax=Streptomyces sp. NPDC001552 TaxID=3364587 RepID=UPI0036968DBD
MSAAVPEPELRAVCDGAAAEPSLLRRLAPALQLHAEDLFVIASVALPPEMTPLDPDAGGEAAVLARRAMGLPRQDQERLRRLAAALPQQDRTRPAPEARPYCSTRRALADCSCACSPTGTWGGRPERGCSYP